MKMSIRELVKNIVKKAMTTMTALNEKFPVGSKVNAAPLGQPKSHVYKLGQDSWYREEHLVDFESYFKDMDVNNDDCITVEKPGYGAAVISTNTIKETYKHMRRGVFELVNREYDDFVEKNSADTAYIEKEGMNFKTDTFRIAYEELTDLGKEDRDRLELTINVIQSRTLRPTDKKKVKIMQKVIDLFLKSTVWEEVSKMAQCELDDLKRYAEVNAK